VTFESDQYNHVQCRCRCRCFRLICLSIPHVFN
jgi:hypothetical protein